MPYLLFYEYRKCSTCRKAREFLEARKLAFESIEITATPPPVAELKRMLGYVTSRGGSIRSLFNTSGLVYKEMNLASKLPGMGEDEGLRLLASTGRLIKRPFVLADHDGVVGFRQAEWEKTLLRH